MELKFGKHKGKMVEEVSNSGDEGLSYLDWLAKNTDPNDPKYGKNNKALLAEIKRCMAGKTFTVREKKKFRGGGGGSDNSEVMDILTIMDIKLSAIVKHLKIEKLEGLDEVKIEKDDLPF